MSRVSVLERLYRKPEKSALEFDYDALWAPPILSLFYQSDIDELYRIATSVKLSGKINKKYQLIDAVMNRRGFRFDHRGTNRSTYRFLEDPRFLAKVAVDKVGIKDSPAEFKNQNYFKPFCCKIFEVDPTGVIAFVEKVNPITSLEEFESVSDDIFNLMATKIIGKYVVDDLGTTKYMNYGIRIFNGCSFGPVIIDFPYAYELDGAKLMCTKPIGIDMICGGEIDYDAGFNNLICTRCGKRYSAKELGKETATAIRMFRDVDRRHIMRVQLIASDGSIITDSGMVSDRPLTKEEFKRMKTINYDGDQEYVIVNKTVHHRNKREKMVDKVQKMYQESVNKMYHEQQEERKFYQTVVESEPEYQHESVETVTSTVYDGNVTDHVTNTNNDNGYKKVYDIVREMIDAINESIPELNNPPIEETKQEEVEEPKSIEEPVEEEEVVEEESTKESEADATLDNMLKKIDDINTDRVVTDEKAEELVDHILESGQEFVEEALSDKSDEEEDALTEYSDEVVEEVNEIMEEVDSKPIERKTIKPMNGPQIISTPSYRALKHQEKDMKKPNIKKESSLTFSMQEKLSNAMMSGSDEEPDYSNYEPKEEAPVDDSYEGTEYDDNEDPTYEKHGMRTKFRNDMSDY